MDIRYLFSLIIRAIDLLIFARVILSFIPTAYNNPIGRFIYDTSEPILRPIRRIMPDTGMIDFSPLVLFLILGFLERLI